jgi:hypothetical protein
MEDVEEMTIDSKLKESVRLVAANVMKLPVDHLSHQDNLKPKHVQLRDQLFRNKKKHACKITKEEVVVNNREDSTSIEDMEFVLSLLILVVMAMRTTLKQLKTVKIFALIPLIFAIWHRCQDDATKMLQNGIMMHILENVNNLPTLDAMEIETISMIGDHVKVHVNQMTEQLIQLMFKHKDHT